jgi:hypothetical protein
MAAVRFGTLATATCSTAPAEVFATMAVTPALLRFGIITP